MILRYLLTLILTIVFFSLQMQAQAGKSQTSYRELQNQIINDPAYDKYVKVYKKLQISMWNKSIEPHVILYIMTKNNLTNFCEVPDEIKENYNRELVETMDLYCIRESNRQKLLTSYPEIKSLPTDIYANIMFPKITLADYPDRDD